MLVYADMRRELSLKEQGYSSAEIRRMYRDYNQQEDRTVFLLENTVPPCTDILGQRSWWDAAHELFRRKAEKWHRKHRGCASDEEARQLYELAQKCLNYIEVHGIPQCKAHRRWATPEWPWE